MGHDDGDLLLTSAAALIGVWRRAVDEAAGGLTVIQLSSLRLLQASSDGLAIGQLAAELGSAQSNASRLGRPPGGTGCGHPQAGAR